MERPIREVHVSSAHDDSIAPIDTAPVSPTERDWVLHKFNDTAASFPENRLIHELFEDQVKLTPDAVALMHSNLTLTYIELDARSSQLARYLRHLGVNPNQPVGICVERTPQAIVGVLGILKAGGAYLPLDPNYPADRLRYMLEDSRPPVVLMQEKLIKALPSTSAQIIEIDARLTAQTPFAKDNLSAADIGLSAQDLVYVIYTSGSTGLPKGTAMPHRAMINLIDWHRRNLSAARDRRVLQFAPLSFDVAFQEIFSTLCTGGTLVLVPEWVRRDPRALLELLISHSIQRLFLPPVVLQKLAECSRSSGQAPSSLRDVIVAGEQLRITPDISTFFRHLDGCRLHNHYGPTETHVVTTLTLPARFDEWPLLPPIGRPISNTQIFILNEEQQPVPPGVTGEIYIAGAGVARGYLGRPDLTAQRFIPNPFSPDPSARMYRTGDLGRWQPDGVIEYFGRNDCQVKIRGFRVEPGEVEAVLESYPGVKQAVVIATEDEPGDTRLVGYVVANVVEPTRPEPEDANERSTRVEHQMIAPLRVFLLEKLPHFMVPAAIVFLDELPLSPNGKVDRSRLPAPNSDRHTDQPYAPPGTPIEKSLSAVWAEVLTVHDIGIDDNFFELGGDSLMGMELIDKVARKLEIEALSIIALFESPTIREMAQYVETFNSSEQCAQEHGTPEAGCIYD